MGVIRPSADGMQNQQKSLRLDARHPALMARYLAPVSIRPEEIKSILWLPPDPRKSTMQIEIPQLGVHQSHCMSESRIIFESDLRHPVVRMHCIDHPRHVTGSNENVGVNALTSNHLGA